MKSRNITFLAVLLLGSPISGFVARPLVSNVFVRNLCMVGNLSLSRLGGRLRHEGILVDFSTCIT
jgi:hypothetical protein